MNATRDLAAIRERLQVTMMPHEVDLALPIIEEIQRLKQSMNVVVLGHNYMTPEVYHGVSDYVGDSLGLSRLAAETDADIILFNGVHFMAETAKVLNPEKTVLIADTEAGCSLAESITAEDVRTLRAQYPGVPVVTYVNCTAAVKAETDICCTSANAVRIVQSLPEKQVIFLPDEYLARNVALAVPDKQIISWQKGKCMVHELFTGEDIRRARSQFEDLLVISHPECNTDVTAESDFSGSTSKMEEFIGANAHKNVMLVTECSMSDNLRSAFPDRNFVTTCQTCPHMKKITLQKVLDALRYLQYEVTVPEETAVRARKAVERMLAVA